MEKFYLIAFNNIDADFNATQLHNHILGLFKSGRISAWWHYLYSVYIVKTALDVNDLYNEIFPGIPMKHLLVIEVNLPNSQGWLSPEAWKWIQSGGTNNV